jgi:hypothetical protein
LQTDINFFINKDDQRINAYAVDDEPPKQPFRVKKDESDSKGVIAPLRSQPILSPEKLRDQMEA